MTEHEKDPENSLPIALVLFVDKVCKKLVINHGQIQHWSVLEEYVTMLL